MSALLALEDVACIRGGRLLFEGLNLQLGAGEAALVTGPNGVGKSSLLRLAGGLLAPSGGRIRRDGSASLADERLALDERQTVEQALGFWARFDGADPGQGMAAMGIAALAAVPVRMLSTGQRKRATLARVVSSGAPLWLLDEPANGLDAQGRDCLGAAVEAHRAKGGAVLVATHQPLGLGDAQTVALA